MEGAALADASSSRLAPLHHRQFRRVVGASALATAGDWMQTVAAAWLIFELTHSATAVGVLTVVSRLPSIFASSYGGVLADRFDKRRLGVSVAVVQAVAAAALAVSAGLHDVSVTEIYVATLVIGVAGAIAVPLTQGIVPSTVPPELIGSANALTGTANNLARMIGPVVGGGLVVAIGVEACFALNAASFLPLVAVFATIPRGLIARTGAPGGIRVAVAVARRRPLLVAAFIWVGMFSLLIGPIQELAPVIAHEHASGAHVVGFLLGALAAGSVIGSLVVSGRFTRDGRPRYYVMSAAGGLAGLAVVALALAPSLPVALLTMALAGVFWEVFFVLALTGCEVDAPAELYGRELGLFYALTLGGLAIGAPLTGALLDVTSVQVGLLIVGISMVVFAAFWMLRLRWVVHATPRDYY